MGDFRKAREEAENKSAHIFLKAAVDGWRYGA